jgi:hypothetical protein
MHQGCKENEAFISKNFTYRKRKGDNGDIVAFLLPVEGYPEYFVHFSMGRIINNYEYS